MLPNFFFNLGYLFQQRNPGCNMVKRTLVARLFHLVFPIKKQPCDITFVAIIMWQNKHDFFSWKTCINVLWNQFSLRISLQVPFLLRDFRGKKKSHFTSFLEPRVQIPCGMHRNSPNLTSGGYFLATAARFPSQSH